MSALEFIDVTIAIGERIVLADVNLQIADAEFVGVLGPNGAGKTTLMRAALGLVRPVRGSVRVLDQPARRGNPAIGYMPQGRSFAAAAHLSGWDYVAAAAGGHRWGLALLGSAARREIAHALELVEGTTLARRPLSQLSGGERQRLLLAQALLGQPRLLLLDEPLISLDPHHQQGIVELVRRLQRRLAISVLFSAHELNPLLEAMDRVLYLGSGHATLGTVDQVINGPTLSRLYGSDIEVIRHNGRVFVMSGSHEIERDEHRHRHA